MGATVRPSGRKEAIGPARRSRHVVTTRSVRWKSRQPGLPGEAEQGDEPATLAGKIGYQILMYRTSYRRSRKSLRPMRCEPALPVSINRLAQSIRS